MKAAVAVVALSTVARIGGAQQIDTANALGALRDALAACTADGGRLWGVSLCGPIALIDRQTRLVIANDTVGNRPFVPFMDAFVTTAPANAGFANTAVDWGGRRWSTVLLPLDTERFARTALVMHEVFHREQPALHLVGGDPPNNHLDQLEGRRWLRLEIHALAAGVAALDSNDRAARAHVVSALTFRARRRALFPAADTLEPSLEMQEGLAEYTGERLALTLTKAPYARAAREILSHESAPTFVRSFAYATGPALGLLLDRFSPDWRTEIAQVRDPAKLLAHAVDFHPPRDLAADAERRAKRYDGDRIAREEIARDSTRRVVHADYRKRLVDGPTITLRQEGLARSFNPQNLIGFDASSTVYPTGSFGAPWGSLEVERGALVSNDYKWLRIAAPANVDAGQSVIQGDGWKLTLNKGWRLTPVAGRPGSFEVAGPEK